MKVATVIGTRPEIIKMAPIIPMLDEAFEHRFIFSGQHYSRNMVEIFLDEMDVRRPDEFLNVHASEHSALEDGIGKSLQAFKPHCVLVYGDTNSTLAAARVTDPKAALIHIEAGIRSFDLRMPEEHNRIETDRRSTFRLAPTGLARYFLMDMEGYPGDSIEVVGNLVVDAYLRHKDRIAQKPLPASLKEGGFALLTMHRAENVDEKNRLGSILESLSRVPMPVVFPVHPRTQARMESFGLTFPSNLITMEPLGYFDFMRLFQSCHVIITDSGGVQEEAVTIGVPCVTLRDNTERMETVFARANFLYDADHRRDLDQVIEEMASRREMIQGVRNPFGDGDSSERITEFLKRRVQGRFG